MTIEAWFAVGVVFLATAVIASHRVSADVTMLGALTILLLGDAVLGGVLPLTDGLKGFAHPAVVMIGSLFVVAAGLAETGGMMVIAEKLLGQPRTIAGAQLRMMTPVALLSGFMNNTPIVVMYLPIINDWARKLRVSPSKLYMPLSFAALLGGKITMIGTASNVVVMGLYVDFFADRLQSEQGGEAAGWLSNIGVLPFSPQEQFWAIALLGVPTTIAGIVLVVLLSRWLLPERRPASQDVTDSRRYQVEMRVLPNSPIVGKSIEQAGLRHLPGLYLTQIERGDTILHAVGPDTQIEAEDSLAFAGILDSVVDLRKIRGLVPATDQVDKVLGEHHQRTLVEAVVAHSSGLVGKTVRASRFRTRFNAAIIAVHRNGKMVEGKIGDIVLYPGDVLLLDTHYGFVDAHRNSDMFYLVSNVADSRPVMHERSGIALAILVLLIALLTLSSLPPTVAALTCAGLMIMTRCVTADVAHQRINWPILLVIGGALGIGESLKHTGAAVTIAHSLLNFFSDWGPYGLLLVLFLVTMLFAQVITSYGAAVLMFPITMATAESLGVNPEPFVLSLMVAAGSTYLTPVAYQTNLMVYGPGGYRFFDYTRLGAPLVLLIALICLICAPMFFPF
jgi:di/tricarboxylate transporter